MAVKVWRVGVGFGRRAGGDGGRSSGDEVDDDEKMVSANHNHRRWLTTQSPHYDFPLCSHFRGSLVP